MAVPIQAKVTYHSDHGDAPGWVIEHDEGHEGGNYKIGGFTTQRMKDGGGGDVFNVWSQPGDKQGQFTVK